MKPMRSGITWVLGWAWMVFAAANLVDIAVNGSGRSSAIAAAFIVAVSGAVFVMALRPRVVPEPDALRIVNPLREVRVPWGQVADVDVTDLVRVHTEDQVIRVWALRENRRRHVRANLRGASGSPGGEAPEPRPVMVRAEELRGEAERRAVELRGSADPNVPLEPVWSPWAIAVLALPAAVLLAVVLFG